MAEVGAVYDVRPVIRTPKDVLRSKAPKEPAFPAGGEAAATVAENKWVTASVVDNVATVVEQVSNEAEQRDPTHAREWIGGASLRDVARPARDPTHAREWIASQTLNSGTNLPRDPTHAREWIALVDGNPRLRRPL